MLSLLLGELTEEKKRKKGWEGEGKEGKEKGGEKEM